MYPLAFKRPCNSRQSTGPAEIHSEEGPQGTEELLIRPIGRLRCAPRPLHFYSQSHPHNPPEAFVAGFGQLLRSLQKRQRNPQSDLNILH
jgi:hypothetical protein